MTSFLEKASAYLPSMSPTIPKKMKAAVIEKSKGPLVVKEVDVPEPEANEVLIKVKACGVCHSDAAVQQGLMDAYGVQYPVIPGHEVIGTVVKLGSSVTKWKEGDLIGGGWHGGHDGVCKACNRGLYQMCDNEKINGVSRNGGYAEYATVRAEAAVRIPAGISVIDAAPLLCAGVTTFNGIRQMNVTAGDIVAVQGLGGLGHLAIQYARKMGYRTVALSSSDAKRDFAFQLGATDYVDGSKQDTVEELQKLGGASLIVVTAPNPKIMEPLARACGPRGKVLILAPVGPVPVDTGAMIHYGVSVHGWPSGHAQDSEEAIAFAQHQDVKCLTEEFKLDDVQKAFDHMMSGKVRFRAVLNMEA